MEMSNESMVTQIANDLRGAANLTESGHIDEAIKHSTRAVNFLASLKKRLWVKEPNTGTGATAD